MKNLLSQVGIFSALTWGIGYFHYNEGPFIHIFLVIAVLILAIKVIQEIFYMKKRIAQQALLASAK